MRFFEEKGHSLSVAPEPLAIWNKKLEGLESYVFWKLLFGSGLLSDVNQLKDLESSLKSSSE